jgi:hypothetical protein
MKIFRTTMIALMACGLMAGPALAGSGGARTAAYYSRPSASFVVRRSPNIGFNEHLRLYVDGRFYAVLGYGRSYEGVLPPGEHVVALSQVPHLNDAYPVSYQRVRVRPGESNVFTAKWVDGGSRIALERS